MNYDKCCIALEQVRKERDTLEKLKSAAMKSVETVAVQRDKYYELLQHRDAIIGELRVQNTCLEGEYRMYQVLTECKDA